MVKPAKIQPVMPNTKTWSFFIDFERIGWLTIDTPSSPVNVLSREALGELEVLVARFEDLIASDELVGVVLLSGKSSGFIAGADVTEFDEMADPSILPTALKRTHALFNQIEKLKAPTVCGIHGFCLGGGLELALACQYRIAVNDDKTCIGFPEVKLGIFPGFGGTGRAIRQAGPVDAMGIMLTGRYLRAGAARGMNLVDKLVGHRDMLRWEARKAIMQKRTSRPAPFIKSVLSKAPLRGFLANKMREQARKKARPEHYPAPYALIDLFEKNGDDPVAMSAGEIKPFVDVLAGDTSANLRRLFFLSEGLKKQGVRGPNKPGFKRVHVVGGGVMGGDIAAWCAMRGMSVTLQDLDLDRITLALKRAKKLFKKRLKKPNLVAAAITRLEADVAGNGIARADVIIEAVVENLKIKQKIFAGAEAKMKPGALLATNTSSIELERIAEVLEDKSALIGLHFFNPVAQLPLVEIIQSKFNTPEMVAKGASFASAIGKSPVVVKSAPGFLVNRVLMPYILGAVERVEGGESKELLDAAAAAFGMPMGPIELIDTIGLDVGAFVAEELKFEVSDSSKFSTLIKAEKLGRKTGEGFYVWEKGKAVKGDTPEHGDLVALGRELVKPLVDECEACVADGIVTNTDLADIGVIFGTGFAPFLGGPMKARADNNA